MESVALFGKIDDALRIFGNNYDYGHLIRN